MEMYATGLGVVVAAFTLPDGTQQRVSLSPGSLVDGLPAEVAGFALATWTEEVRAAFAAAQEPDAVEAVPLTVSARQIRLWLIANGFSMASVDAAIDGIQDQQQRDLVRVEWEYAPWVERTHSALQSLAGVLGLDPSMVDQAFTEAAGL